MAADRLPVLLATRCGRWVGAAHGLGGLVWQASPMGQRMNLPGPGGVLKQFFNH
jgi:hypothetical protein